jgi:hypothetical protein
MITSKKHPALIGIRGQQLFKKMDGRNKYVNIDVVHGAKKQH